MWVKMKTKTIIILFNFLMFCQIATYGFNHGEGIKDTTNEKKIQVGIYTGYIISTKITDAHGNYGTFFGQPIEATVEGITIEQNWGIGINTRYYLINNFDIEVDLLYSNALFPEQKVTLERYNINQPKSDLNFFTISVGPGFRYRDEGIWQVLNPYAFLSLSILFGFASDVNISPVYGKEGYSTITGIGFNVHFGTQYYINNFILLMEYRFEYLNSKVDHFRSFTEGLSFIKSSSYLLLGLGYSF